MSQSRHYLDPETNTSREIDIVASQGIYTGKTFATIRYIVECKRSPEKPWILFTRENKIIDWEYTGWYCTTAQGWNYIIHAAIDGKFDKLPFTYHLRDRIAYGIKTAFISGEDSAYKAMHSTVRCAISYINRAEKQKFGDSADINIPIIVLEGKLFDASLNGNGILNVHEIKEGVVLWDTIISGRSGLAVHIVTKEYIEDFVKHAFEMSNNLINDWKLNLDAILDEMNGYS